MGMQAMVGEERGFRLNDDFMFQKPNMHDSRLKSPWLATAL